MGDAGQVWALGLATPASRDDEAPPCQLQSMREGAGPRQLPFKIPTEIR